jgi:hypothetical protein
MERDIAQDVLLIVLADLETMALLEVSNPAFEPLNHVVCLWPHWCCEAMFDAAIGAKLVELMPSRGWTLAKAEGPVCASPSVIVQHPGDLHPCHARQVRQEAARNGSSLCCIDVDQLPASVLSMTSKSKAGGPYRPSAPTISCRYADTPAHNP